MAGILNYHRMSLVEKQALARERMREPAVTCPACETQTTATDLIAHLETRCPGRRAPSATCAWISWKQALALGVPRATMNKWVTHGKVRVRGELQSREYLMRDVVQRLAASRQRRQFTMVNQAR